MSKIKLSKLSQDNLEIQELSKDKCEKIIGGMSELSGDESPRIINTISKSWFCQKFPNHPCCRINPGVR